MGIMEELEKKIMQEIYRLQMLDYPSKKSEDNLKKMQTELKKMKEAER